MAETCNTDDRYQMLTFFAVRIIFTSDFLEACGPPVAIDCEISSEYILQISTQSHHICKLRFHECVGATCSTPVRHDMQ